MDPILVLALVLAIGCAVVAGWVAVRRGRTLEQIAGAIGAAGGSDAALEARLGELMTALDAAEGQAATLAGELAVLRDAAGSGIVRVDQDLVVLSANAPAHAIAGRAPGSMSGRSVIEAFVDRRIEDLARVAASGQVAGGELVLDPPDGATVLVRARPVPGRGAWLVLEDVSELRRLQRIRAEFIDNLSHELRTPLTTVSLLSETLAREADASGDAIPARMRDRISRIEVETGHLVQMVNELLDLARIEGGRSVLRADEVDLARLARSTVERLRLFAERQGVELRVVVDGALPPARGDEDRLGQVIVNLVHNAVKFSPEGGPVTIRIGQRGDEIVTAVEDHGIGIPATDQPRIFERFYKVDRARVRGGGTGLGLAIARHVVAGHGGRIWVTSEEGRGSTFSFSVPIATPSAGPAPAVDGSHAAVSTDRPPASSQR